MDQVGDADVLTCESSLESKEIGRIDFHHADGFGNLSCTGYHQQLSTKSSSIWYRPHHHRTCVEDAQVNHEE